MKILYCNKYNFPFSGTEVYLFEAMEMMRAAGHEVALFSMADPRGEPTPYDHHFVPHIDFKESQGILGRGLHAAHAIYSSTARRRLRQMIEEFRPDLAHIRNIYHHLSPSILWELRAQHVPVLYHLNDFKVLCPSYNMVSNGHACERCRGGQFWRVITENCYYGPLGSGVVLAAEAYFHHWLETYEKCVDRFLAPSRFVKDKLVEAGWKAERIDVLPHFQRIPEHISNRSDVDTPILFFGRLSPEKGVADLLRAMQRIPRIRLSIAGDGPQRAQLESLSARLGLVNVEFLGHLSREQLDCAISNCCFSILPSHAYETLGKSILESFAHGRPVIASDLGSRRELIKEGKNGLLFRAGDIEQLAGAISFLYDRPALAKEMGSAGREYVREHHSPETYYQALTSLYQEMSSQRARSAAKPVRPKLQVSFIGGRGVLSKYSGIEAYYEEVGQQLVALGHDVTVYCRTHFTPPQATHNGMRLVRLPTLRSKHFETLLHTILSTGHALLTPANIIHYHALGPALFSFIPRLFGKKTIVTVQGLDWQRKKWGCFASSVLRLGEMAAVKFPTSTTVVSRTLQQYYASRYKAPTFYIPNGADCRERCTGAHLDEWRLEPDNYILYLGRFSPEKNCHLLISAYEQLQTPVKLAMAGGSSYTDAYESKLRAHQSDCIRLLNYVSGRALDELLTNALLFVLPSDLEGLSLALLDAMGAGVCVLASDIPENCELVEGAGFTFKHGDISDLARMLLLLIFDAPMRRAAAVAGQHKIRQRYQWHEIAREIEREYWRVLGWKEGDQSVQTASGPGLKFRDGVPTLDGVTRKVVSR
ncbi:MAG TPA: glycosyltransferase family 4 protein [Terriglobales bacterium]